MTTLELSPQILVIKEKRRSIFNIAGHHPTCRRLNRINSHFVPYGEGLHDHGYTAEQLLISLVHDRDHQYNKDHLFDKLGPKPRKEYLTSQYKRKAQRRLYL
jgi:hypothetical protein